MGPVQAATSAATASRIAGRAVGNRSSAERCTHCWTDFRRGMLPGVMENHKPSPALPDLAGRPAQAIGPAVVRSNHRNPSLSIEIALVVRKDILERPGTVPVDRPCDHQRTSTARGQIGRNQMGPHPIRQARITYISKSGAMVPHRDLPHRKPKGKIAVDRVFDSIVSRSS